MNIKIKKIYHKLTCPVVSACIVISAAYFYFLMILPSLPSISQLFYNDVNFSNIRLVTKNIRNQCGSKYFTIWMSLQMNKSKDKFIFKEIKGCNEDNKTKDCSFDVKIFNPYYEGVHFLDYETYKFINSFSNEDVFYTNKIEDIRKYSTINKILNNTNKIINGIGIKVVKDIQKNIIYVFGISHLENATKCNRKMIVDKLEELNKVSRKML